MTRADLKGVVLRGGSQTRMALKYGARIFNELKNIHSVRLSSRRFTETAASGSPPRAPVPAAVEPHGQCPYRGDPSELPRPFCREDAEKRTSPAPDLPAPRARAPASRADAGS